jgi:hypothetical protein
MSSPISSSTLETICNGNYDRGSRLAAAKMLLPIGPEERSQSLKSLIGIVKDPSGSRAGDPYLHEACRTIMNAIDEDPSADLYAPLETLINALKSNHIASDQKKIAMTLTSVLTQILMRYHSQKQTGKREIGKLEEKDKQKLIDDLRAFIKTKMSEFKDKNVAYEGDIEQFKYYLSYIEAATYLLDTEKGKKEKYFEMFGHVVIGVLQIAQREVGEAVKNFAAAFEKKGKSTPKWFGAAFAIQMLEVSKARQDFNSLVLLIDLIGKQSTDEALRQGMISLGNCALYGKTPQIRQCAYNKLETHLSNPKTKNEVLRVLAKISKGAPEAAERSKARHKLYDALHSEKEGTVSHRFCDKNLSGATDFGPEWYHGELPHSNKVDGKTARFKIDDGVRALFNLCADSDVSSGSDGSGSPKSTTDSALSSSPPEELSLNLPQLRNNNIDRFLALSLGISEEKVSEFFPKTEGLYRFIGGRIKIEDKGFDHLAQVLAKNADIKSLDLRNCSFSKERVKLLSATSLTLVKFNIKLETEEEAKPFAEALRMKKGLIFEFEDALSYDRVAYALRKDDTILACQYADKAVENGKENPKLMDFYLTRILLRRMGGNIEAAEEDNEKLMKSSDPHYRAQAWRQRAIIAERKNEKNYNFIIQCYRSCLEEDSSLIRAQASLSHALLKSLKKQVEKKDKPIILEANELIQFVIKKDPNDPYYKTVMNYAENYMKYASQF